MNGCDRLMMKKKKGHFFFFFERIAMLMMLGEVDMINESLLALRMFILFEGRIDHDIGIINEINTICLSPRK
jgi:hypothetical protein